MIAAITSALTSVLGWLGSVIGAITDTAGDLAPLLPLFAIAIAISLVLLTVKVVRKVCWGA